MSQVVVRKVENALEYHTFFAFPWRIYKDDPNWVPVLKSMRHEMLSKTANPAWEYMEGEYFIAWRGSEPVGTIAAFINHRHNEHWQTRVGWFGAFECIDDQQVANALLKTAEDYVRGRGYPMLLGPQTFTTHEEVGLLIDGFEQPLMLMSYHPRYYQRLIETAAGYTKSMDVKSYYYDWDMVDRDGLLDRLKKVVDWRMKKGNITIRMASKQTLKADFELIKRLYNACWDANWGFVPLTDRERDAMIKSLGMLVEPQMLHFAYIDGEPVGLVLAVGDIYQVFKHAYPRPSEPELFTLLKVLWHWKVRNKMTRARVPMLGVLPEHRNKGIDLVLIYHLMTELRKTYVQAADSGWILETNQDMAGTLLGFGMREYRTYRIYQKALLDD
jgi:GNAT superfamily N-acetyltransferase